MPNRRRLSCLIAAALSGAAGAVLVLDESRAQEARAAYGYVTANLNQRAGPGTQFPPLQVIPARSQVLINGCLPSLAWCEGTFGDTRGWMSAQYLRLYDYNRQAWVEVGDYARSTRLATFSFDLDRYWYANYRDRPFYPQRAAWRAPPRSPAIDHGVFYRELAPYGRWVLLDGRYVWMPAVGPGWRPYTDGRWEYTHRYGWTWVSNEPFGWATYHYGRWAYSNRLGWVWVPGTQWAPAWVAWRGSEDHLAWAPLPPDAGPGFALDDGFDAIPGYYWQVVPAASFLLPNLLDAILRDDGDRRPSLERSRPLGNATVENNVVVNNVVNIDYVEEKTRERVVQRELVITNDAAPQAQAPEEVVRIYQPPVTEAPASETPAAVLPADIAAGQSQTTGQAGDEPATEDRVSEAVEDEAQLPPTEAPPLAEDEAPPPAEEQPAADAPAAEASPPAPGDEPAPPADQPPPPADEPPPPPAADEPPPPPDAPASPAEEPPPPATEAPPAPPAAEESAPPTVEEPPPPPPAEAPPAPTEEPAAPPPTTEAPPPAEPPPPPPPPAAEQPEPPQAEQPPPPPPPPEAPPAPPAEPAPPPPAAAEPPPEAPATPPVDEEPPPPAVEEPLPAPEPPPPAEPPAAGPPAEEPPPPPSCPEGTVAQPDGSCVEAG